MCHKIFHLKSLEVVVVVPMWWFGCVVWFSLVVLAYVVLFAMPWFATN